MLKYFYSRLLILIPMILIISFVVFLCLELTPGDAVSAMFSADTISNMTVEQLDALRDSLGLNDPLIIRYFRWVGNILKGDFGISYVTGKPINQVLESLLPATLKLAGIALLISTLLGLTLGILAAIKQNTALDYSLSVFGVIGISLPEFFVGILMILFFAIKLKWFPAQGRTDIGLNAWQSLKYVILPSCSLGLVLMAALMRYTRNSMLDVLSKDYVKTARAKGLPEWKIYTKHAFRNSLMPISVLLMLRMPMLIGGSVIIEQVFGYAGIGQRLITAINSNDYPVVLIIVLMLSTISLFASVMIDVLTALLDPRVRIGGGSGKES